MTNVQRKFRELNEDMKKRKKILNYCFEQSYNILYVNYATISRKQPKYKKIAACLQGEIDEQLRDFLIDDWFSNICRKYVRYR